MEFIFELAKWLLITVGTIVFSGIFITFCLLFLEWIANKGKNE